MASTDDYFRGAVITAMSPDQCISATLSNNTDLEIRFRPRMFDRYDEATLSHQLCRLAQATWVARQRARDEAYRRARALSSDELAAARRPSDDPRRRAYDEALNRVEGQGVSADGSIRIRTQGMLHWRFEITRGTPQRLGEEAFVAQIGSAYKALLADRELKITVLKSEHFDMAIPRKWLETMQRLQKINRRRSQR